LAATLGYRWVSAGRGSAQVSSIPDRRTSKVVVSYCLVFPFLIAYLGIPAPTCVEYSDVLLGQKNVALLSNL